MVVSKAGRRLSFARMLSAVMFAPLFIASPQAGCGPSQDDDASVDSPSPDVTPSPLSETPGPASEAPASPAPTPTTTPAPAQDQDGDGVRTPRDCDDHDAAVYPGAVEVCDEKDNNCNGQIDEGVGQTWYFDQDGDGYGSSAVTGCIAPAGYVPKGGDCDDGDASVHPYAWEYCDGKDNDCDHAVDEDVQTAYYRDQDGDGWGAGKATMACTVPDGYTAVSGDCDDQDATVHPAAEDTCNDHIDQNCNGTVDDPHVWYRDEDGDGHGSPTSTIQVCAQPAGYVPVGDDCDDTDPLTRPGAPESCDGKDNDCDGQIDELPLATWYIDLDGDGFGGPDGDCTPEGRVEARGDCDDTDPSRYPGHADPAGDGIDSDCGGFDGPQPHVGLSGDSFTRLQDALSAAVDGEVVWVGPGTWDEHDLTFAGRAVSLMATHHPEHAVIDAKSEGRVFDFVDGEGPDTLLDGFTLTGGLLEGENGAGVRLVDSSPTLRGLVLQANRLTNVTGQAADDGSCLGAGMYLERSEAILIDLVFNQNRAFGSYHYTDEYGGTHSVDFGAGGGIYAIDSTPKLTGCAFAGNRSVYGGGLSLKRSDASQIDCTFEKNEASGTSSQRDSYDLTFSGALGVGGGVYAIDSTPELAGCRFDSNKSPRGGGLFLERSSPSIEGCTFLANESLFRSSSPNNVIYVGYGGGIGMKDSSPLLSHCLITGNYAIQGGGIDLSGGAPAFQDCDITDNFAGSYVTQYDTSEDGEGGGLHTTGSSPTLTRCAITGNEVGAYEGGYASYGGGIFACNGSHLVLTDCSITGNFVSTPETFGGGMYLEGGTAAFTRCEISDNTLLSYGVARGAGLDLVSSSGTLTDCRFTGNLARSPMLDSSDFAVGGALSLSDSSPAVLGCAMVGNYADSGGGGLHLTGSSTPSIRDSILAYNSGAVTAWTDLYNEGGTPVVQYTDLYNPSGMSHNLEALDATNQTLEPGFLAYLDGQPSDLHLALGSPLIDAGDPSRKDVDESRADLGIYGGPEGAAWDRDGDLYHDWFWPGTLQDAPEGYDPGGWDCDDGDGAVQSCTI